MAVVRYNSDLADPVVSLYNGEGAFCPFIAHLTPRLFERRVLAKSVFDPAGVFVATHVGKVVGAAFATFLPTSDKSALDFTRGSIDGLFFSERRPAIGDELLSAALVYLKSRGARTVTGWATEGNYPFWRDLYCGSEPVMHAASHHVHEAFHRKGFHKSQHSVALLARTSGPLPDVPIHYLIHGHPAPRDTFWERNSWLDLWPMLLEAHVEGVVAGTLGWSALPATSRRRGVRTAGIHFLSVDDLFRRRGVATALLARCFEEAKKDGAEEILVATSIDNRPALASYRKFGFSEVFQMIGTRLERI